MTGNRSIQHPQSLTHKPSIRFNPFSPEFKKNPYPIYEELRKHKPIHKTMGMWVMTRHADVQSVLRDRTFSSGLIPRQIQQQAIRFGYKDISQIERLAKKSLVFTDNPDHTRLRRLVNRVFTAPAISKLNNLILETSSSLLDKAWKAGGMDIISDFASPLPHQVMCRWMDLPLEVQPSISHWTHEVRFLLEPGLITSDEFLKTCNIVNDFSTFLRKVIADRRHSPGDDLISQLTIARTSDGDVLSDEELIYVCIMCFVAGNETTKSLIGNGVLALLQNTSESELLRKQPDLVANTVSEILRYETPLQQSKRLATVDIIVGDVQIREGDQVLLCIGAANRDPEVFANPNQFDITRDSSRHLAFGYGMHSCLGGLLAELQSRIAFTMIYSREEKISLATQEIKWQENSFIVRGLESLLVTVAS